MIGLSKQKQKYIQSLHNKKYRHQIGVFLVEGRKGILELIDSDFIIEEAFLSQQAEEELDQLEGAVICSEKDLTKLSTYKTNNYGLVVVKEKPNKDLIPSANEWILALDAINDPGNLGTIIRIADWYGISKIICSKNTVEWYNPKVISASMGSFTRIECFYTELNTYLKKLKVPIYGAFLGGENVHRKTFTKGGLLLIGSESHGISTELSALVQNKITIPSFGEAESLNAAVATGIILDNISRG